MGRKAGGVSRPTAPAILDPILARWERLDRRRRHIRPIRRGGLLGLEQRRFRGHSLTLADGTQVRPGDRIGDLHLDNARAREFGVEGWLTAGWREGRRDLEALAAWTRQRPVGRRPVTYGGATILAPFARRAGFEVRARPRTGWSRVEDWYKRSVLRRWNPRGAARLSEGRGRLQAADAWISDAELQRRFGDSDGGGAVHSGAPDADRGPGGD